MEHNDKQSADAHSENARSVSRSASENEHSLNSDLIRGNIDTIILRCLHRGEMYGLEICNLIKDASGGTYILKQPTLYSSLKRLEARKMISSFWRDSAIGGRRHYYKLTELGLKSFTEKKVGWHAAKDVIDTLVDGTKRKKTDERSADYSESAKVFETPEAVKPVYDSAHSAQQQGGISEILPYNPFAASDDYLTLPVGISEISNKMKSADLAALNETAGMASIVEITRTPEETQILQNYILNSAQTQTKNFPADKDFQQQVLITTAPQEAALEQTKQSTIFAKYLAPGDCAVLNANRESTVQAKAAKIAQYDVKIEPFIKHYDGSFGEAFTAGKKNAENKFFTVFKKTPENNTGLILVNKLQFFAALIVSALTSLVIIIFNLSLTVELTKAEKGLFTVAYLLVGLYFLTYLLIYAFQPKQKENFEFTVKEHIFRLMLSVVLIVVGICVNILVGLTFVNLSDYLVFMVVPSVLFAAIFFEGIVQALLCRNRFFSA